MQFNNTGHNDQSVFDPATNQFVAPVAGVYALGFRVMFKANAAVRPC
ncbi:C1q-like domain-containing protein [Tardiphaga sp. 866_E4_N2_1]